MDSTEKVTRSLFLTLLDTLRIHLINSQFAEFSYGTTVPTADARLIDEIARNDHPTIDELALLLGMHKSSISRKLEKLEALNWLRITSSPKDARRLQYRVLRKGENFIQLQREFTAKQVSEQSKRLSAAELKKLVQYMREFASGGETPNLVRLPDETDMLIEFRRLTYAHGVITGDYLGSGHPAALWVLLSEVRYHRRGISELQSIFGMKQSAFSQRLKTWQSEGMILLEPDPRDRRARILLLGTAGEKALARIERRAESVFARDLQSLTDQKKQDFLELLKRYVGGRKI